MGAGESKQRHKPLKYSSQPADKPSVPGKPQLVPSGKHSAQPDVVTIRWEPPFYDGGSRITGYLVEHRRTGSPHWVRSSPNLVPVPELTLSGLEPGWRYQFRVSAQNVAGLSEPGELSDLLTVTLQRTAASAPFFVKELQNTVAIENEKAELSVQVRGTPTPTIAWFKDGVEIFSSRSYRVVTDNELSTLIIHQAAFSDEGEIKCSATNRVGYAVSRAKLTLEAPPSIRLPRQYEEGLLFEKDEVIRLKVSVAGRPTPKVSWQLNGEAVGEGGRYEATHSDRYATLRVCEAKRTDRGEYQVRAVNRLGEDVASFLVTVADRPMPPGKAKVVMTLGRSVTLCWTTPEDDGGCKIGNYIVEYYRLGWNMWLKAATCRQLTTTLGELIEGSEYKFRVKAENPYGVSDPSPESDVVFIPDPKRGLLEPPEHGTTGVEAAMDVWLEEKKRPISTSPSIDEQYGERKTKKKRGPLTTPQVQKADQNTSKQSMNSEDSLSPPPTPEGFPPVIPKRRTKVEKTEVSKDLEEEKQLMKKLEERRKVEEFKRFEERKQTEEQKAKLKKQEEKSIQFKSETNLKSKKELITTSAHEVEHSSRYGSSELMLVLLPNSRAATEERETTKRELFESSMALEGGGIAPPMSLSAPELGSGELLDFAPVRAAYSSSELLHELSMARFYNDMEQEAKEMSLKTRSSLQRRRSFGSRTKLPESVIPIKEITPVNHKIEEVIKTEELTMLENISSNLSKRGIQHLQNKSFSRDSMDSMLSEDLHRKSKLVQQTSEEDMEYEDSSFDEDEEDEYDEDPITDDNVDEEMTEDLEKTENEQEYDEDEEAEEYGNDEKRDSLLYTSDSEEEERRLSYDIEEESTYHPGAINLKYNEDTMISAYEGRGPLILHPVSENQSMAKPVAMKTMEDINTEIVSTSNKSIIKDTEKHDLYRPKEPFSMSPEKKFEPNFSPVMPKPILKVREPSQDKYSPIAQRKGPLLPKVESESNLGSNNKINLVIGSDHETSIKKKQVRIEEPQDSAAKEQPNQKTSNIPSSSQEQPNLQRTGSLENEADAARVLISHYSDIVAEFGKGKRPYKKKYLNYEALKAAAEEEEKNKKHTVPDIVVDEPDIILEKPEVFEEQSNEKSPFTNDESSVTSYYNKYDKEQVTPLFNIPKEEVKETLPIKKSKKRFPSPRKPKFSIVKEHVDDIVQVKTIYVRMTSPMIPPPAFTKTQKKVHSYLDFAMDFSLFILACWLYLFKDERLSIPVMCLMIYRQANEAFQRKMEALRNKLPRHILFWRK